MIIVVGSEVTAFVKTDTVDNHAQYVGAEFMEMPGGVPCGMTSGLVSHAYQKYTANLTGYDPGITE